MGEWNGTERRHPKRQTWFQRNGRWLRLAAYVLVAAAVIFSTARTYEIANETKQTQEQQARETAERRDQICLSDEREHLLDVTQLTNTYNYLESLPDDAFVPNNANQINIAVLRQLPQTEDKAKTDVAPEFCDVTLKGGKPVGLPEPDPIVPQRPERIDKLLKELQAQQEAATKKRIEEQVKAQDMRNPDQR